MGEVSRGAIAVNRRIGGLEIDHKPNQLVHSVNRRIGGLEKSSITSMASIPVNRRIGGLEIAITAMYI